MKFINMLNTKIDFTAGNKPFSMEPFTVHLESYAIALMEQRFVQFGGGTDNMSSSPGQRQLYKLYRTLSAGSGAQRLRGGHFRKWHPQHLGDHSGEGSTRVYNGACSMWSDTCNSSLGQD